MSERMEEIRAKYLWSSHPDIRYLLALAEAGEKLMIDVYDRHISLHQGDILDCEFPNCINAVAYRAAAEGRAPKEPRG